MAERKGAAKRCVLTNGPAIVVPSRVAFTRSAVTTPNRELGAPAAHSPTAALARATLVSRAERGRAPHTHASQPTMNSPTRARAASGDGRGIFLARASYCFGRERETQRAAPTRPTRNTGQGRLVPRRGRAPAARDRGPRHAQVVRPRGAPAGPHGQAVPGAVAQPAEPRHQQAALDGRRGQGHIEELRAVRRALGRHRPGPARAHGQRRQEPLEL